MISEDNHLLQHSVSLIFSLQRDLDWWWLTETVMDVSKKGKYWAQWDLLPPPMPPSPLYQNKKWSEMTKKQTYGRWEEFRRAARKENLVYLEDPCTASLGW